jgi:endonuclease/exonuclease/phosphatase family metal-dependent hydrolase
LGITLFEFAPHVELRAARIPQTIIDSLADIVCLQEVFSRRHLQRIVNELSATHPYWSAPRSWRPKLFGSGLAIFSRYPVIQSAFHWFRDQLPEEAIFAPRAYLAATIETAGIGRIEIVNCHTTAGGPRHHPESETADHCRANQLDEVMDYIKQRDSSVMHSLIAGDLNCGPEASPENFNKLLSGGFADLFAAARGSTALPVTWDPQNSLNVSSPHKTSPPQRIDHVLSYSRSDLLAVEGRLFGIEPCVELGDRRPVTPSDHYGVVVGIKINHAESI